MSCYMCKGGSMVMSTTNHVVSLDNGCIIIIKNVPCEKCSQCGEVWYSGDVAEQLEKIVEKMESTLTEIAVINYPGQVA